LITKKKRSSSGSAEEKDPFFIHQHTEEELDALERLSKFLYYRSSNYFF
jgi:hypothetical protein